VSRVFSLLMRWNECSRSHASHEAPSEAVFGGNTGLATVVIHGSERA